eukprot:5846574-Amphidinium_carterae.1
MRKSVLASGSQGSLKGGRASRKQLARTACRTLAWARKTISPKPSIVKKRVQSGRLSLPTCLKLHGKKLDKRNGNHTAGLHCDFAANVEIPV